MKKIVKIFSLVLVLIMGVAMFTACSPRPKLDIDKAKENLEAAEYVVYITDEDDYDVVRELYATKLDLFGIEEYITIMEFSKAKFAKLEYQKVKAELDMSIEFIEFEIKELELQLKHDESLDDEDKTDLQEDIARLKEEKEVYESYVIGRSGKYMWVASSDDIVKATK